MVHVLQRQTKGSCRRSVAVVNQGARCVMQSVTCSRTQHGSLLAKCLGGACLQAAVQAGRKAGKQASRVCSKQEGRQLGKQQAGLPARASTQRMSFKFFPRPRTHCNDAQAFTCCCEWHVTDHRGSKSTFALNTYSAHPLHSSKTDPAGTWASRSTYRP